MEVWTIEFTFRLMMLKNDRGYNKKRGQGGGGEIVTQRLRVVIGFRFGFLDLGSCSCSGFGVGVLENGGETGKEILYTHPRNLSFDGGMWYGKRAREIGCLVGWLGRVSELVDKLGTSR